MLAADPESLKGLSLTGVLSQGLANCLMGFCGSADELAHFPDHEDYERISDVLRAGPKVVRHRKAMGRRVGSNGWLSCNRAVWSGASRSLMSLPTLRHSGVLRLAQSRWITC